MTDTQGEIDYRRVRELVAVTLAILGGFLALAREVFIGFGVEVPHGDGLGFIITGLVLPVTGGTIAGSITAQIMKRNGHRPPGEQAPQ